MTFISTSADLSFPSSIRLRKRADYLRLSHSKHKHTGRILLIVWQENNLNHARLGITVSKKIGCSVVRNRLKRYVRESFRVIQSKLPAVDINVIARSESATMDFYCIQTELLKVIGLIGLSACSRVLPS